MKKLPLWRRPWGAKRIVEVGGGHAPFSGVTHSVDKYPEDNTQRGGNFSLPKGSKFFQGDLESMPFPPGTRFDFLYASHVFEHVENPQKAGDEINRVAQKGYLETPSPLREQIACPIPFDSKNDFHLYFCWSSPNAMHFVRKSASTIGQFPNNKNGELAQALYQIQRKENVSLEPLLPRPAKTTSLYFSSPLKIFLHDDFHAAAASGFCAYEESIAHLKWHLSFPLYLRSPRFRTLRKLLRDKNLL